jgi:hypothetical protein
MFDLNDGEAQASAVRHQGSGIPHTLSSGSSPKAAPILTHNPSADAGSGRLLLGAEHVAKLRQSALTDAQIQALTGWRTLPDGRLEIPYWRPDGSPEQCHDGKPFTRWRLSDREIAAAKAKGERIGKYRSRKGNGCRLYHSALAIAAGRYPDRLQDRFTPLRLAEGECKTEAANAHDPERLTIGLGGVSSWRDRYDGGEESRPLVDFDEIPLDGREVRLCFDSDFRKPQVAAELRKLAEFLASCGAHVLVEVLPNGLNGERLGVDDLIYRHGPAVFSEVAAIARSPFKERRVVSRNGVTVFETWAFNPEPQTTRERNAYLFGMLGQQWRCGINGKDHWQRWTGTNWDDAIGDDPICRELERFAALQGWQNREWPALRSLQAAFRRSIEPAATDGASGLLPFRNGCLLLDDLRLIPHDPAHGNTWVLPYDYNPAATCPGIEALLLDRLGDQASVAVFRAFCRALLTGERLKCFLEITGPSNTGKSVLGNLLRALVGDRNTAAITLQRLEDRSQRFETAKLAGKRLVVGSECQDYSGPLEVLKALTGDDSVGAEIKGGRHFDFTYGGGVVLVGNRPVRVSDTSGAVINRRRSFIVSKVVASADQRDLLKSDNKGGWKGELTAELPGLVNWALAMLPGDARAALAQDVRSLARAEIKLETLLTTDGLADWADQNLIWDPLGVLRVGVTDGDADLFLYPSYLRFMDQQSRNSKPLSGKVFKAKLVDLLRNTLGLALPPGTDLNSGEYRQRGLGSVVPCLRFRRPDEDDAPGVIRHAVLAEVSGTDQQGDGTGRERIGNGKTPVGNGWNGWNGSEQVSHKEEKTPPSDPSLFSYIGNESAKPVPSVPSIPQRGSQRSAPVPPPVPSVPPAVPEPLVNAQVATVSTWVSAAVDGLNDQGITPDAATVYGVIKSWRRAPAISRSQVKTALAQANPAPLTIELEF